MAAIAALLAVGAALASVIAAHEPRPRTTAPAAARRAAIVTRTAGTERRQAVKRPGAPPAFRGATIAGAAARRARVPILMYHVLAPAPHGTPFPQLWVPPRTFRAQLRALVGAGYTGVTLSEVLAAWRRGAPLPRRPVVLSFDDGYSSDATVAAPALELHWPGVLDLAIRNAGRRGLHVAALRVLVRNGWEVDSHTVDHPDLTTLPRRRVRAELVRSRAWIRRTLGVDAPFFCYPAGRFDAAVVAAVRAAGYRGATTELPGVAGPRDDRFELPRVRVTAATSASSLLAEL